MSDENESQASRVNPLVKGIVWFGSNAVLACDGRCDKAWGSNNRPTIQLSADEDDYAFLSDGELGAAPLDPGTYEGPHGKPTDYADPLRQNKWCARECERSEIVEPAGRLELADFAGWVFNMHKRSKDNRP